MDDNTENKVTLGCELPALLRTAVVDAIRTAVDDFNGRHNTDARVESCGNYDTDFCIVDGTLDEDEAEPIFTFSNGVGNE